MKKRLLGLIPLALATLVAVGAATQQESDPSKKPRDLPAAWRDAGRPELRAAWDAMEGKPAPSLGTLRAWTQTKARSWRDLRGKVVLLDLWGTWCPPCVEGLPHLKQLHERHADDGLVVLGVHVDKGRAQMAKFVKDRELPWAFATDPRGLLAKALGVNFVPAYFAIDRNGILRIAGANRGKLDEIVKALLAEPATAAMLGLTELGLAESGALTVRGERTLLEGPYAAYARALRRRA